MKKKLLGGFLVVAILATAGLVAARVNTTEASAKSHSEQRGVFDDDGVSAQQSESTGKPYIGIAVTSVPERQRDRRRAHRPRHRGKRGGRQP